MDSLLPIGDRAGTMLKANDWTIAVSESSTGGLISAALLAVPGASAYFSGGGVIYTREARRELLQLPDRQVKVRGATEDYALIAARAIQKQLDTTWALAESGASGPTGSRYGPPAGHTCLAVAGPVTLTRTLQTGDNDRIANMRRFGAAALALLIEAMSEAGGSAVPDPSLSL